MAALSRSARGGDAAADAIVRGLDSASSSVVKQANITREGDGLVVEVTVDGYTGTVEQIWYANLAYGALVETGREGGEKSLFDAVSSATVIGPDAQGEMTAADMGISAVALGQQFNSPTDEALTTSVREVARQFDLSVAETRILHPLESALHLRLEVSDAATVDWSIADLTSALIGERPRLEGLLIDLVSESGSVLLTAGTAYRTGLDALSFAEGEDERFGAVHGSADFD